VANLFHPQSYLMRTYLIFVSNIIDRYYMPHACYEGNVALYAKFLLFWRNLHTFVAIYALFLGRKNCSKNVEKNYKYEAYVHKMGKERRHSDSAIKWRIPKSAGMRVGQKCLLAKTQNIYFHSFMYMHTLHRLSEKVASFLMYHSFKV